MNPIDVDVISRKKAIIIRELNLLKELNETGVSAESSLRDQHVLSHCFLLIIAGVIDIAQHICSDRLDSMPASYHDMILSLSKLGVLDKEFAENFARVAKLRNFLVHLYDNVDYDFLGSLVEQFISDVNQFLKDIDAAVL